jgi:AraC-like DNA-binding protein
MWKTGRGSVLTDNVQAKPEVRRPCGAIALCPSATMRRVVLEALPEARIEIRMQSRELPDALRATGASLVIVEELDADGEPTSAIIHRIRQRAPAFDVVVLTTSSDPRNRQRIALSEFGPADVLAVDAPGFADALREAARRTRLSSRLAECGEQIAAGLRVHVADHIRVVFGHGRTCASYDELAGLCGVSRRTLERHLAEIGLSPERLVGWRMILHVLICGEHTLMTVERAALRAGYDSLSRFSDAVRNYTGLRRADLLRLGGSGYAIGLLRQAIARSHV